MHTYDWAVPTQRPAGLDWQQDVHHRGVMLEIVIPRGGRARGLVAKLLGVKTLGAEFLVAGENH